jgi:hypothetical protein
MDECICLRPCSYLYFGPYEVLRVRGAAVRDLVSERVSHVFIIRAVICHDFTEVCMDASDWEVLESAGS